MARFQQNDHLGPLAVWQNPAIEHVLLFASAYEAFTSGGLTVPVVSGEPEGETQLYPMSQATIWPVGRAVVRVLVVVQPVPVPV